MFVYWVHIVVGKSIRIVYCVEISDIAGLTHQFNGHANRCRYCAAKLVRYQLMFWLDAHGLALLILVSTRQSFHVLLEQTREKIIECAIPAFVVTTRYTGYSQRVTRYSQQ